MHHRNLYCPRLRRLVLTRAAVATRNVALPFMTGPGISTFILIPRLTCAKPERPSRQDVRQPRSCTHMVGTISAWVVKQPLVSNAQGRPHCFKQDYFNVFTNLTEYGFAISVLAGPVPNSAKPRMRYRSGRPKHRKIHRNPSVKNHSVQVPITLGGGVCKGRSRRALAAAKSSPSWGDTSIETGTRDISIETVQNSPSHWRRKVP